MAKKSFPSDNDLFGLKNIIIPFGRIIAKARVVILGIIILSLVFRLKINLFIYQPKVAFFIFAVYLLCSILFLFFAPEKMSEKQKAVFSTSEIIADLLFISLLIYFSGDINSRLAFLYIVPVISATIISLQAILLTTTASLLLYYGIIYFINIELIGRIDISSPSVEYFSSLQLIRHGLTILIVAFAGFYYTKKLKEQNKKILELKDEFMFMVLHDVKSPATAIRFIAEKYRMPDFAKRYPGIQEDILMIEESIGRIFRVSESMLLLAKNQHMPIINKALDIVPIIKSVLKELEPGITEKHITVEYHSPQNIPLISANADFLKEAFANILGNAIKYNNDDGRLAIDHKIEGNFLRTSILNTGPRIEPKTIKNLFNIYYRGNMENKTQGTGIGLYFSRKLIERMRGSIGVESSSDEKTIFYMLLPLASEEPKL